MIIDSHCHIHDKKFDGEVEDILLRAKEANITHLITIGCDINTTKAAKKIAIDHEQVFYSAGFHPHDAKELTDSTFDELKKLSHHKKCIAIGECGLDYYYKHSDIEKQKEAFIRQIDLSNQTNLPLIIHLRDAFDDCYNILKTYRKEHHKTVIHCFSGTFDEARKFSDLGCYISLSGILTFKKPGELPVVAKKIPLDKLIIETDAPYLAPVPKRGKRNEPSYIIHTLNSLAKYRDEEVHHIERALYENTRTFFSLH